MLDSTVVQTASLLQGASQGLEAIQLFNGAIQRKYMSELEATQHSVSLDIKG
jgi:hypothetical protein